MSAQHPDGDGWWSAFRAGRDRSRRARAVNDAVRDRSHGRDRHDIEADLTRSFAAAGIPQPPERIALRADVISDGLGRTMAGLLEQAVQSRQVPPTIRLAEERLAGSRWVNVTVSGDRSAQAALRWTAQARANVAHTVSVPSGSRLEETLAAGPPVRLTLVPSPGADMRPQIGAFLNANFIGTIPLVEADVAGLWPAIQTAEAADRRLVVRSRIEAVDGTYVIAIALP